MRFSRNIILFFTSFLISIFLAEILVRLSIGGPKEISERVRVVDKNFGYKVNSTIDGVDTYGFRNLDSANLAYDIATIGDSHTWGYNVEMEDTWPFLLQKSTNLSVYNMGVGGNGIYSYHYLIKNELQKGKKVILGLYLPNDFERGGYGCFINFNNSFWFQEVNRLNLNPPECIKSQKKNTILSKFKFLIKSLQLKSSILTLAKHEIYVRLQSYLLKSRSEYLFINEQFQPISFGMLEAQSKQMDISNIFMRLGLEDFKKMLIDWTENTDKKQLGIIVIPSRQLVYRSIIVMKGDENKFINLDILNNYTENEIKLEQVIIKELNDLKIPSRSVRSELTQTFINNFPRNGVENFYPDKAHPGIIGHKAYALSATKVLNEMENFNK